jgi:hypothetical protein
MAEKLSIQIALAGGAEIERQLQDIGAAGQKAFADISKSAEQVGFNNIKPEEVTAKLQEMGVTGVDSIKKIQDAVQAAGRLETLVQGITSVENALLLAARAAPIVGAAIVAAMTSAAKATIAFAGEVNKVNDQAIKLGTGVQQVDKFRAGLEKAGVSAQSVGEILKSKLASEQGIQGLEAFIRQLEQIPDSAARSKAAVEQFGAAGAELIRILQAGGRLTGFATGGLISAEDAKKATELSQALSRLESSIGRLNTLGFAPALTTGISVATKAVELFGARLEQAPWQTFLTGAQLVFNPIQGLVNAAIAALTAMPPAINKVGIAAQQSSSLFTQFGTAATTAFAGVGTTAQQTGPQITGMFTQWGTSADEATTKTQSYSASIAGITWENISSLGVQAWNSLIGAIQGAIDKLLVWIGLKEQAGGTPVAGGAPIGGGGIGSNAAGGLLGGRGSGTSDSNLAWVSRGEYITPARAVAQPGMLAFLEALRRSGGNLSAVLNGMGRFALGGMVPRSMPAFAGGGPVGSMSHVTIQFPGLPAIGGLRASSDVVDQLHRAAALAQIRSGGRKPSRYS